MYNAEKTIEQAIDSVLNQTYRNWEMIIVDDKSTDRSVEIVNEYVLKDSRIKLYRLDKNVGTPYFARNYATDNANGELIAFLDSDDIWLPEKLEKQVGYMLKNDYNIVYSYYERISHEGVRSGRIIKSLNRVDIKTILRGNPIGCLTAIYDKGKVGKLYQINHKHEDYIMWISVMQRGFVAYCYPEVLALYRISNNSVSNSKIKMAIVTWNIYRKVFKLNFFRASKSFVSYSLTGILKFLK